MVTVIDYAERTRENGDAFYALILQGGIEMVQSQSGGFYVTARKTSIPSTFDENTCQALVGQQIPGSIQRQECEPYEYSIPDSGEVITLTHTYRFVPEGKEVEELETVPEEVVF